MHFVIFSYSFDIYAEKSYYEDWCEKQRDFNYDWQISEFFSSFFENEKRYGIENS